MASHFLIPGAELKALEEFARDSAHWYYPEKKGYVPGDHREHVRMVQGLNGPSIRVVFSYSMLKGGLHRHASFSSIPGGSMPPPSAVFEICRQLGFTGTHKDWIMGLHEEDMGVIVVAQTVTQEEAGATP